MNKKLILTIVAVFITVQPLSVFASNNTIPAEDNHLAAYQKLYDEGVIEQIENKINTYYENFGEESIYSPKFESRSIEEKAQVLDISQNRATSGSNTMPWDDFFDGDIVLVHDGTVPYGYYRHCGTYFASKGKFISAQAGKGVIYESKSWYNLNYDEAVGLHVATSLSSTVRPKVMRFLEAQIGKRYGAETGYMDYSSWSCSKLPWVGWGKEGNIKIAVNPLNGKELTSADISVPDSLYRSNNTYVFAAGN